MYPVGPPVTAAVSTLRQCGMTPPPQAVGAEPVAVPVPDGDPAEARVRLGAAEGE